MGDGLPFNSCSRLNQSLYPPGDSGNAILGGNPANCAKA
jgi:hypothetical protein